jgi:hypothetical protein
VIGGIGGSPGGAGASGSAASIVAVAAGELAARLPRVFWPALGRARAVAFFRAGVFLPFVVVLFLLLTLLPGSWARP